MVYCEFVVWPSDMVSVLILDSRKYGDNQIYLYPAYRRHWISRCVRIEAPLPNVAYHLSVVANANDNILFVSNVFRQYCTHNIIVYIFTKLRVNKNLGQLSHFLYKFVPCSKTFGKASDSNSLYTTNFRLTYESFFNAWSKPFEASAVEFNRSINIGIFLKDIDNAKQILKKA